MATTKFQVQVMRITYTLDESRILIKYALSKSSTENVNYKFKKWKMLKRLKELKKFN